MPSVGPGAGASFWTPDLWQNLTCWYDGTDLASMTFDSSGLISAWRDKGPRRHHLSQGTGANQPKVGTMQGLPAPEFGNGGATTFMDATSLSATGSPITQFVVFQPLTTTTGYRTLTAGTANDSLQHYLQAQLDSKPNRVAIAEQGIAGYDFSASTQTALNKVYISTIAFTQAATSYSWLNGASEGSVSFTGSLSGAGTFRVGSDTAANYMKGNIGSVVRFAGILSDTQRVAVELMLAAQWRIPHALSACSPPLVFT